MPNYEYQLLELPHDRAAGLSVASQKAETFPQINAILNEYGKQGWMAVSYSDAFNSAGSRRWPRVLLMRAVP